MIMRKPRWAGEAELVRTLLFFDGPQVALLRSDRSLDMLAVHAPQEDMEHGMFACEISKKTLSGYINEKFDLRYVFTSSESRKKYYMFDWESLDGMNVGLRRASRDEIDNDDNYPDAGFFARHHSVDMVQEDGVELEAQRFKIDGSWAASDFSRFYGKFADLYAFLSLPKLADAKTSAFDTAFYKNLVQSYFWRGGGSYVSFYDAMFERIQILFPLNVSKIRYASPGYIEMNGGGDRLREIERIMTSYYSNRHLIQGAAKRLDDILKNQGLKRAERGAKFTSEAIQNLALKSSFELAKALGIEEPIAIFEVCEDDVLTFSKIMLSFYRRSRDLYAFHAEGRVQTGDEALESVADA